MTAGTHLQVVPNTVCMSLQPQVVDGEGDPASRGDGDVPATQAVVRIQVGVVGGGDGA